METEKKINELTDVTFDELQQRHRQEKKALQSRIQQMKKTAGKPDKKKKKELEQTITQLEEDLKRTHLQEVSDFESRNPINSNGPSLVVETQEESDDIIQNHVSNAEPRISRAQRRRDKKAESEALRQKQIAASELEAGGAERAIESAAIKVTLQKRRLCLVPIAPDGDCLYGAIRHQLRARGKDSTVESLRRLASDYIMTNRNHFSPFMCDPVTGDMLTDHQFDRYCKDVASTKAWGGQIELQALSSSLRTPIHVIQADPPGLIIQGEEYSKNGDSLILTYHRHLYGLGEHYNSTRCLDDGDTSPEEC